LSLILSLDQSTSISGFAILDHNAKLINYGTWNKTKVGDKSDLGHTEKRVSLKKDLQKILNDYPDIIQVVCEGTYKNNTQTYKKLCKIEGTIQDFCYEIKMPCFSFENAGEWRKLLPTKITGKREEVKEKTKIYILSQYPELPDDLEQDIYDAIGIGLGYLNIFIA
jgi:Holliday junction resolvasome RuvABC endonuclease subunit